MARFCTAIFLSAVRVIDSRCKRHFAPAPDLSQDNVNCTKEMTKEIQKERERPATEAYPADTMNPGVGRKSGGSSSASAPVFYADMESCVVLDVEMRTRVFCHGRMANSRDDNGNMTVVSCHVISCHVLTSKSEVVAV